MKQKVLVAKPQEKAAMKKGMNLERQQTGKLLVWCSENALFVTEQNSKELRDWLTSQVRNQPHLA